MEFHKPRLPDVTMRELRENDNISFEIVMLVVRDAAQLLYNANPATHALGLEKCEEAILDMIDDGHCKIMWDEHDFDPGEDRLWIGYFNPATGEYEYPAFAE